VDIDLKVDLDSQGPFDIIVQKLTDELVAMGRGDRKAATLVQRFELWCKRHPEVLIVDPLEAVSTVIDRYRFGSLLQQLSLPTGASHYNCFLM
jgi:inositol-1,3,4-trisphosphate 5/6-kinase/inositol-tetrakisphosphate 1-kinase